MCRYISIYYILWSTGNLILIETTEHFALDMNQCIDICSDSFFLLPKEDDAQKECQRGCRFSNIIDLTAKKNLSDIKNDCHESCEQSYIIKKSKKSCIVGCDAMMMKKQSEVHYIFPYLDQYNVNDQEFESIEADFFLDPLIRQQVQQGYDIKYKIPEAYIRTLPIGNDFNLITGIPYKYYKTNTECASLITFSIFGVILIGFLICVMKIVQSMQAIEGQVQLITYHDTPEIEELTINRKEAKTMCEKANDQNSFAILV